MAIPEAVISKTPADTPSHTLLLGKIRVMGNTSLTLYSFPLIQAPLYLQQFSIDHPKITMEAVTHHGTPDSPWDSLGTTMFYPYHQPTDLWEDAQAMDAPQLFPSEDLEDTTTNPDIPSPTKESK